MNRAVLTLACIAAIGCGRRPPHETKVPVALPSSPIQFSNRAAAAGIAFVQGHSGRTPLTILDTAGSGCAWVDVDGDGWLDAFLVGQPRCALYLNQRNGAFVEATRQYGLDKTGHFQGVATGDIDGDRRTDVIVTGYRTLVIWRNAGDRFVDVTPRSGIAVGPDDWMTSAALTDLDGDGKLDLALCRYVRFTETTPQTCRYADSDSACPPFHYDPQTLLVYRGDGRGGFVDVTRRWGFTAGHGNNLGVAPQDFDGDGRTDLYVANDGLPGDLWRNAGQRRFINVGVPSGTAVNADGEPQAGMGVDWADIDQDGRPELLVTTFQDEPHALYHNEGGGLFRFASEVSGIGTPSRRRLGFGIALSDFDGDGFPDALIANGHVQDNIARRRSTTYAQPFQLFRNRGDGTFAEVDGGPALQRPVVGRGLAVGDYDNDGRPDVLAIDAEGAALLLHNDSPSRPWIGLSLVGPHAVGATVRLVVAGKTRVHEVQTGRSYLSSADPRVLFAFGNDAPPRVAVVRWANGREQRVTLAPERRYTPVAEATLP